MIYLLGQILLCLVLAAIAGWFVGWSWRGFRETDRLEDLRRTLRATEEVKDRELAEAQRRADGLQTRVETLERRLAGSEDGGEAPPARRREDLDVARWLGEAPEDRDAPDGGANGAPPEESEPGDTLEDPGGDLEAAADAQASGAADWEARVAALEAERALLDEQRTSAERELLERAATVRELEAEVRSLRRGAEDRAEELARLERRVVELEPLERDLEKRVAEIEQLKSELAAASSDRTDESSQLTELDERVGELEAAILERDRRINELRQRYQETAARLEVAEADQTALRQRLAETASHPAGSDNGADLQRCREQLREAQAAAEEARSTLQRQIERNRKQEAVHQQVVANLRDEIRDARATGPPAPTDPEADPRVRQVIADRDSKITSLLRRLEELEGEVERRPPPRDNLQKIRGIGPKLEELLNSLGIHSFAQIASWSDDDVERVSERLGVFRDRIRWDDWVESARRHHILAYGKPPEREDWWLPEDE